MDPILFPHAKVFNDGRVAYVTPLTYGRARLCVTTMDDLMSVHIGY